jgi:hypothetical protein
MGGISNMVGWWAAIIVEDSRWIGGTLNKEIVVSRRRQSSDGRELQWTYYSGFMMAASRETSSYCAVIVCLGTSVRSDGVGEWWALMGFYRGWIDDGSEGRSRR